MAHHEHASPTPPPPLPADATPEQREAYWYDHVYQGDNMPQLTVRAVLMGAVIGVAMSIAHLYTSLKIGWGFGVAITACVISYVSWNVIRTLSGGFFSRMSILENNCMQSTASAAGYSTGSTISTAVGAMLLLSGSHFPWYILVPFVLLSGLLGVFLAIPLKRQMINIEQLRFPSGIAAAETLRSLYSEGREAMAKAYTLLAGLAVGAVFGVLQAPAGILHWLDAVINRVRIHEIPFPTSWASQLAADQGRKLVQFGFNPSVLLIGAGMITGLRVSLSMLLGSVILYFFLGPWVIGLDAASRTAAEAAGTLDTWKPAVDVVGGGTTYHLYRWSLWGGTALMVFASFTSLALQWKTLARAFTGFGSGGAALDQARADRVASIEVPIWWLVVAIIPITIGLVILQHVAWGTSWWLGVLAVILSSVIALVCCRATGETDTTPTGAMGKVTQLLYAVLPGAAGNQTINLMTAGVTSNAGLAAADLLTDLKSGYLLGANPRKQFWAQLIGVVFGTAAVIPGWYLMIPNKEALETNFAAPATNQWKAVAIALTQGLHSIPESARYLAVVGAMLGILLPVLDRLFPRVRAFLPSAMGLGLSWVLGIDNSLSFAIGATIAWIWAKADRKNGDKYSIPLASGFIAGESLLAAIIAILCTLAGFEASSWLAGTPPAAAP